MVSTLTYLKSYDYEWTCRLTQLTDLWMDGSDMTSSRVFSTQLWNWVKIVGFLTRISELDDQSMDGRFGREIGSGFLTQLTDLFTDGSQMKSSGDF